MQCVLLNDACVLRFPHCSLSVEALFGSEETTSGGRFITQLDSCVIPSVTAIHTAGLLLQCHISLVAYNR